MIDLDHYFAPLQSSCKHLFSSGESNSTCMTTNGLSGHHINIPRQRHMIEVQLLQITYKEEEKKKNSNSDTTGFMEFPWSF